MPDESNSSRLAWVLVALLSSISLGAGSTWLTRLDGMAQLKAEVNQVQRDVKNVNDKVDQLLKR